MAGIAEWLAENRWARIGLIALLFPLLLVLSAAIVVLATNVRGWRGAAEDCAAALIVLVAVTALAGGFWLELGTGAAVTWAVAILLGHLGRTGSLTLAVQTAVLLGFLAALAFALWNQEPQVYWERVLRELVERARAAGMDVGPADLVPDAAPLWTGVMAAVAVANALAALFLGNWWTGSITGRGFAQEFQNLRMGRVLGALAGVVGILFLTSLRAKVDDLLIVLGAGFVVQGLAIVHWHGARREWPKTWPLALYLPLALFPRLAVVEMLVLALLGLFDNGFSLRRPGSKVV